MKKILIIKPSSLGDIIQANPTLIALRKAYPEAEIHWVAFDVWADILGLFGVDASLVWKRRGGIAEYLRVLGAIRKEKYDLVVDLQGLLRSALLARLSGARGTIGVPGMKEGSHLLLREAFPESRSKNAVHRSLEVVRHLTGKEFPVEFRIAVPAEDAAQAHRLLAAAGIGDSEKILGIVPGARGKAKQWPAAHYGKLIDILRAQHPGTRIVFLGSRKDAGTVRHPAAVDLCGGTSLRVLAGVLKRCAGVVGSDTGAVHLAAALDVPTVVIFGGSDIRETAPVSRRAVALSRNLPCSPCRGTPVCRDYACLSGISPEEVAGALAGVL